MDKQFEYHTLYTKLVSRWYYIFAAIITSIFCAYFYIMFSTPLYRASASIKLEDKKSELTELITIKNIYDRSSKSETEKFILSSRNVLTHAIDALDQKVSFFVDDRYHQRNIYPTKPVTIEMIQFPDNPTVNTLFTFEPIDHKKFSLTCEIEGKRYHETFSYGYVVQISGFTFKIIPPAVGKSLHSKYYFRVNPISEAISTVSKSLQIDDNLNTNILNLSFTDANPRYAKDMLNSILGAYQEYDRNQRSISMKQTSYYIDTLLQRMSMVLHKSALEIQNFKTGNHMINISSNSDELISQISKLETEKHELSLRNLLNDNLRKALDKDLELSTLNFNTSTLYDPQLNNLLNRYNLLIDKKSEALVHYPPSSAYTQRLDEQISGLKREVMINMENQNRKDQELFSYLNKQIALARQGIASAPALERNYIMLQSEFNINQKVYDYLSEKKLEAEIATAAVIPNAQLIDEAEVKSKPVYPVESNIYKDFIIVGTLFGGLLIVLAQKFDTRLYEVSTVEEATAIPIIGTMSRPLTFQGPQEILALDKPRSLFSESVRAMRANLQQLISRPHGTVICITSAIAGEGKSFTSLNLAGTLSLIEKKVLIIATDLRKSILHKTFNSSNHLGLSTYLSGEIEQTELCLQTQFTNIDFIPAGPLPAHPAELLQSPKMIEIISSMRKKYDFIILDTAPVGLVADTVPLMRLSDINLFVLRYGISSLASIALPEKLKKEFNLKHIAIVLNAFKEGHSPKGYYSLSIDRQSYSNYEKVKSN